MNEKIVSVSSAGVVRLAGYDTSFTVNAKDILDELGKLVEEAKPQCDYDGKFAGRVTITVEFLGDMKEPEAERLEGEG